MARLRHTTSVAPTNPRMRVTGLNPSLQVAIYCAGFQLAALDDRAAPFVKRSQCSFTRCPTSRPSHRRFANPLHGWLTFSR